MIKRLKRKGYTDFCFKYLKTKKFIELSRRQNNKITQRLVIDLKDIDWLTKTVSIKNEEPYEPLETYYGKLEIALSSPEIYVEPFMAVSNKEAKEKILIGLREIEWLLIQLEELNEE